MPGGEPNNVHNRECVTHSWKRKLFGVTVVWGTGEMSS